MAATAPPLLSSGRIPAIRRRRSPEREGPRQPRFRTDLQRPEPERPLPIQVRRRLPGLQEGEHPESGRPNVR